MRAIIGRGLFALAGYGCYRRIKDVRFDTSPVSTARHAICILYPAGESEVQGVVSFSQESIIEPTQVVVGVRGLNPNSTFGLQVLEYGDLSEGVPSLGSTYNPSTGPVGESSQKDFVFYKHSGDLGNVMTNEKGAGYSAFTNPYIKLFGENSSYGRSCAVFSQPNDDELHLNKNQVLAAGVIGRSSEFKNLPPPS